MGPVRPDEQRDRDAGVERERGQGLPASISAQTTIRPTASIEASTGNTIPIRFPAPATPAGPALRNRWPAAAGRARLPLVGSITWGQDVAGVYDLTYAAMFEPSVIDPTVDLLAELAGGGRALELAVGTGRVALPLSARGVPVHGIELSPHMAERLRAKPGSDAVPVTIGDMTTTRVPGTFTLVYLVANTIMNVTTQEEQLAVFANAAAHVEPGGSFVVEVIVPQLRRVPPGEIGRVFTLEPDHVGIETFDDLVGQIAWSHHWMEAGGHLVRHAAPYRYVWPSELDLMARIAGFGLRERWAGWDRAPFTSDSAGQVAVFEKSR
jgi:SAM-dependent methyltransferase